MMVMVLLLGELLEGNKIKLLSIGGCSFMILFPFFLSWRFNSMFVDGFLFLYFLEVT